MEALLVIQPKKGESHADNFLLALLYNSLSKSWEEILLTLTRIHRNKHFLMHHITRKL